MTRSSAYSRSTAAASSLALAMLAIVARTPGVTARAPRFLLLSEDEPLDGVGEALVGVGRGDPPCRALHLEAGVAHRDAHPGVREHQHVVRHVADRGDGPVSYTHLTLPT